jgi:hypothetical protein
MTEEPRAQLEVQGVLHDEQHQRADRVAATRTSARRPKPSASTTRRSTSPRAMTSSIVICM